MGDTISVGVGAKCVMDIHDVGLSVTIVVLPLSSFSLWFAELLAANVFVLTGDCSTAFPRGRSHSVFWCFVGVGMSSGSSSVGDNGGGGGPTGTGETCTRFFLAVTVFAVATVLTVSLTVFRSPIATVFSMAIWTDSVSGNLSSLVLFV